MKTEKTIKKMLENARADERGKASALAKTNTNVVISGMAVIGVMTAIFSNIRTKKIEENVRNSIADGIEQMRDDFTAAFDYTENGSGEPYYEEENSSNQ